MLKSVPPNVATIATGRSQTSQADGEGRVQVGSFSDEPSSPRIESTLKEQTRTSRHQDNVQLSDEARLRQLQAWDREVRAHEMAHANVGGAYAGVPIYRYERGPDGRLYAVGGEVHIDTSAVPGDPEATLQKAQRLRAAALAPADPSSADRQIALEAQSMAIQAKADIAAERLERSEAAQEENAASQNSTPEDADPFRLSKAAPSSSSQLSIQPPSLDIKA